MHEAPHRDWPDRAFFVLLTPLAAASLPSLIYCALELLLWMHGALGRGPILFHAPAQNLWDELFALQSPLYHWIARWNSPATLAATILFVSTLLRPRWRIWTGLALIPYGLLLCADFTLHWRTTLHP